MKENIFVFKAAVITVITKIYKRAPKIFGKPLCAARQVTAVPTNIEKEDVTCKCFFKGNI